MDDNMNSADNGYNPQQNSQPGYDQNQYIQPGYGQNQYGQPGYDQNQYGQPGYDQNQYGQPGYDQNQYSQPGYDQNQYGQSAYDQNQYSQPGGDQNQYSQPGMTYEQGTTEKADKPVPPDVPSAGPADGDGTGNGPKKSKKGLIIGLSAAAAVIIAAVLLIFVFDVFGLKDKPENAAEKFLNAYAELDAKAMMDCFLPELKDNLASMGMGSTVDDIQSSFDMLKGFGIKFSDIKVGKAEDMSVDEVKKMMKDEAGIDIDCSAAAKVDGSITMSMDFMGQSNTESVDFDIICVKKGSKWYVATIESEDTEEYPLDGDDFGGDTTEEITDVATEAATEVTTEEAGSTEANTPATGDGLSTTYWTWGFDQGKWKYDSEKLRDTENGSYLYVEMPKPDEPDKKLVGIEVDAKVTTTYTFREDLYNFGIDEHDYVDGKIETVNIGGVDFIKNLNSTTLTYIARLEGANETIKIRITGEPENADVQPALDSLKFTVTDIGNVDGPWYWEGEPFSTDDMTATVGSFDISAKFLKMSEPSITHEVFNHNIAYSDGYLYLLSETVVGKYAIGETGVELQETYTLDTKFDSIMSTDDGRLLLSGFSKPLVEWKDGEIVKEYSGDAKYVALDPSGSFGISYFGKGEEVKKVTISGDSMELTDMPLNDCGTIMHANVSKNHIFLCGSSSDENDKGHKVFVYDTHGALQMTLTVPEDSGSGLGSVTYVVETANGFMAMDGNMRTIVFWDTTGNYIGTLEDSDLFGTNYPWFANTVVTPDGTIFTVMTEERSDKSAKEVLIYQISGF